MLCCLLLYFWWVDGFLVALALMKRQRPLYWDDPNLLNLMPPNQCFFHHFEIITKG